MEGKPLKSQIVKLRKKIFDNLKSRALDLEARNDDLEQYLNDQNESSKRAFSVVDIDTIKKQVTNSDIIYIGDFHTFDQNIRNVLRILKVLIEGDAECIIALEMIHAKHQHYIDAYVEHHLTDLEFLESINYHDSWRFPWTHYKQIFEIAKKHKLAVIGLNTEGSLETRDKFAAATLSTLKSTKPDCKMIVLYGELHITKNKIPLFFQELKPETQYTIIHQNLDDVYWQLIDDGKEEGIVSFSESEFCIISAPPWIKYESMIYWYENLSDDPDFDIHEYIIENGKKIFSDDADETFHQLSTEIVDHLDLHFSDDDIEDFNLYDHTQLEFVEDKLVQKLDKNLLTLYQYLIETNRSFRIPKSNAFYCSSYSMNRISYLVGSHIFHLSYKKLFNQDVNFQSHKLTFVYFCFDSMYSYFFSKIINPHRKCDMYADIFSKKSEGDGKEKHRKLSMQFLDSDNIDFLAKNMTLIGIYECSLIVGSILGEYLYRSLTVEDDHHDLRSSFLKVSMTSENFLHLRNKILKGRDYKFHSKRYF